MGLKPRKVTLGNLKKHIQNQTIIEVLNEIGDTAREIRDERDRHLHRGEERPLFGELDLIFQVMAWHENKSEIKGYDSDEDGRQIELDLHQMHEQATSEIRAKYHRSGDRLLTLTEKLFELTQPEFERRWSDKRDIAKEVRNWER